MIWLGTSVTVSAHERIGPTSNSLCESPLPISLWDTFVDVDCPLSLLKKKRREDFGLEAEFEELAWEGMRSILDIIAGEAVGSSHRNEG
jgi:hypothetical protein